MEHMDGEREGDVLLLLEQLHVKRLAASAGRGF